MMKGIVQNGVWQSTEAVDRTIDKGGYDDHDEMNERLANRNNRLISHSKFYSLIKAFILLQRLCKTGLIRSQKLVKKKNVTIIVQTEPVAHFSSVVFII